MSLTLVLVVAVGTYLFRMVGPLLARRVRLPERTNELLVLATVAILAGLVATQALTEGGGFAGWARVGGVAAAGIAAWRKAPLVIVVLVAVATTAALRAVGVS